MEKFTVLTGIATPLRMSNVDTDQIIPGEYLKRISRHGYEDALFAGWRADPDFVLNQPQYAGSPILVAGPDFGTGSSREHAVWALQDYGFKVVLSSRVADIFRGNSGKVGLLTAAVDQVDIEALWAAMDADPALSVVVDLEKREVRWLDRVVTFEVDDYVRWRLMEGLDDIGLTLKETDSIDSFEDKRASYKPKTLPIKK